jgi:hypothetical protein
MIDQDDAQETAMLEESDKACAWNKKWKGWEMSL